MKNAIATALWAIRHPLYALSWALTRQPYSHWFA
jgi:hypothetical protein